MKQKIDIETWNRKHHFNLFSQFEEPLYGVCVNVDCTIAYKNAKQLGVSFFLYTLHKSLAAIQAIEPFKMRIENDEVYLYDQINGGSTIARSNGTFGFAYFYYYANLNEFIEKAMPEIVRVQGRTDLQRSLNEDLIRYSSLPWLNFTSVSHARMFSVKDSCPRISFGKMTESDGKRTMPVSIHVHHALVDGLHIGQYVDCYQQMLNESL